MLCYRRSSRCWRHPRRHFASCPRGSGRLEPKLDGWRGLVTIDDGHVVVRTRRGRDVTAALPELSRTPRGVGKRQVLLDGELIVGGGTVTTSTCWGPVWPATPARSTSAPRSASLRSTSSGSRDARCAACPMASVVW